MGRPSKKPSCDMMATRADDAGRSRVESIILDPTQYFGAPLEVVYDSSLDPNDKQAILKSWLKDAELLSAAQAENMTGGEDARLRQVKLALAELARRHRQLRNELLSDSTQ